MKILATVIFSLSAVYGQVGDDGRVHPVRPEIPLTRAPGSLTTTFASDNGCAGNMFDLQPQMNMNITSFDIHTDTSTSEVRVYWRLGTCVGNETSSAGWNLLGSAIVTGNGYGVPTPLPIGGLILNAGQVYGIYIASEVDTFSYTNGANTYSNADLTLVSHSGHCAPWFPPSFNTPRTWNGTVYYDTILATIPTLSPLAVVLLALLLVASAAILARRLKKGTT
jgi:hypothetical protein